MGIKREIFAVPYQEQRGLKKRGTVKKKHVSLKINIKQIKLQYTSSKISKKISQIEFDKVASLLAQLRLKSFGCAYSQDLDDEETDYPSCSYHDADFHVVLVVAEMVQRY